MEVINLCVQSTSKLYSTVCDKVNWAEMPQQISNIIEVHQKCAGLFDITVCSTKYTNTPLVIALIKL